MARNDYLAWDALLDDLGGIVQKKTREVAQTHEAAEIARASIEVWFHRTFLRDRVMPLFRQMGTRKILQATEAVNRSWSL